MVVPQPVQTHCRRHLPGLLQARPLVCQKLPEAAITDKANLSVAAAQRRQSPAMYCRPSSDIATAQLITLHCAFEPELVPPAAPCIPQCTNHTSMYARTCRSTFLQTTLTACLLTPICTWLRWCVPRIQLLHAKQCFESTATPTHYCSSTFTQHLPHRHSKLASVSTRVGCCWRLSVWRTRICWLLGVCRGLSFCRTSLHRRLVICRVTCSCRWLGVCQSSACWGLGKLSVCNGSNCRCLLIQ